MVVGDRDYKQIVRDAIDSIGEDAQLKFDTKDPTYNLSPRSNKMFAPFLL